MYESPIQMISEDIIKDIVKKQDGVLLEAVHRVGFDVNKEELERALLYDRNQWERGYADGKMDGYHLRDSEIVRCEYCKHWDESDCHSTAVPNVRKCKCINVYTDPDQFCKYGKRRDDAEVH